MLRRLTLALALIAPCWLAQPAEAAVEAWTMYDTRVRLTDEGGTFGVPDHMRFFSQFRFGPRYAWFGQGLLRMGPIWETHPNLTLATNVTNSLEQQSDRSYRQEVRLEFEPTLKGQWGALEVTDRTRVERSWFGDGTDRWRVRNQVRVTYKPESWEVRPWVSEEGFYILGTGFSENRFTLGASIPTADTDRLDIGYLLRARNTSAGWDLGHVLSLTMVFGPEKEPLFTGPSGD